MSEPNPTPATTEQTLPCPDCGLPMKLDPVALKATCAGCGAVRKIEALKGDAGALPQTKRALGMPPFALWLLLSGFAAAGIAFPVLRAWEKRIRPPVVKKDVPPASASQLFWDVTRPPIFRDLNGDGIDDLVGRYRKSDAADAQLFVGAFDGQSLQPLWSTAPLGDWADALGSVLLAHTGNAIAITDSHGGVELRDLSSGALARKFALPGVASQACPAPDGSVRFWFATSGGGAFVEPEVPQPTPAARPEWCPAQEPSGRRAHVMSRASVPEVPGFEPALVLNEGTNAVAVGLVSGLPTLVGFDPDRKTVRWQHPLSLDVQGVRKSAPLGADLVGGVLYVPYQVGGGRRLVALDALAGTQRWDIAIPGQGTGDSPWERVIATEHRVFVPATTSLAVYDAQSGKALGALGR